LLALLLAAVICAVTALPVVNHVASPGSLICPNIYIGVCCQRYVHSKPVSSEVANSCYCSRLGGTVVSVEKCKKPKVCICPAIYRPVCCLKDGKIITASNDCVCTCNGGELIETFAPCV
jgi:hypothetical protein